MDDDKSIMPLTQRVRSSLFEEWQNILSFYNEYRHKKILNSSDMKSRALIISNIESLLLNLRNYDRNTEMKELKTDEDIKDALILVSALLFDLKIIDARTEKLKKSFITDW